MAKNKRKAINMKSKTLTAILLVITCLLCTSCTRTANSYDRSIGLEMREGIEWCGMRHIDANKDDLPRVLLVGDSIVGAYSNKVSELLKGKVYCSWLTTSRCLGDPVFDQELELMLSEYDYDVIHFNNGLHGQPFTLEQYAEAMERVLPRLQETGAVVIWRTTTPIRPVAGNHAEGQTKVDERNAIAGKLAKRFKIEVDDVAALTKGKAELFADNVHYKKEGINLQAEHIAKTILKIIDN
jgi:hypothetical protein